METTRTNNSTRAVVAVTADDARCVAIRKRYGDRAAMVAKWMPNACARYIGTHITEAVRGDVPPMVLMMAAYGDSAVEDIVANFVDWAVTMCGDSQLDRCELDQIVHGITDNTKARALNFALVLAFFPRLANGDFDLYGFKPVNVLNAYRRHIDEMAARRDHEVTRQESEQRDRDRQQWQRDAYKGPALHEYLAGFRAMVNEMANVKQ